MKTERGKKFFKVIAVIMAVIAAFIVSQQLSLLSVLMQI